MNVKEALDRLALGHRRQAARLLLDALGGPEATGARAVLDGLEPEAPHGAVAAERLRFGPPETWSAWLPGRGRAVLKLWPADMSMPGDMERRLAFCHPGVTSLLAWGPGWTLADWVEGPRLGEGARPNAAVIDAIAAAIAALHSAGLAHGDLKPANIIMQGGRPVLVDWYEDSLGTPGWGEGADPVARDRVALARLRAMTGAFAAHM